MLWVFALMAALFALGYVCVRGLLDQIEELTDDVRLSMLEADELSEVHHRQNSKIMKEINLLKDRMDKMAEARGIEWIPQSRVPGRYVPTLDSMMRISEPSQADQVLRANADAVMREWGAISERSV